MAAAPTGNAQDLQLSAGDAFDLLQNLSPASVDLIITSPPYWGHRGYELGHNWEFFNDIPSVRRVGPVSPGYEWYRSRGGLLGLEPYPEWYISHLAEVLSRAADRLKTSGSLLVNVGDTYFARWSSIRESGRQGLADRGRRRRKTPLGGFRQEKQLLLIPARFAIEMQDDAAALAGGGCPFLAEALGQERRCVKDARFFGVCTVNSAGQDWLVCPLSARGSAAGTVLALPASVWQSWQPFLGAPALRRVDGDLFELESASAAAPGNAIITIFGLDAAAPQAISPVVIQQHIRVDPQLLAHHAFEAVPARIAESLAVEDSIIFRIRERSAPVLAAAE